VYNTFVIHDLGQYAAERIQISFVVPFSDIGDASFGPIENAKHLIRYIVTPENTQHNE